MGHTSAYTLFSISMCFLCGPSHSTVTAPAVLLNVSPSKWLNVGDSVVLSCEVTNSINTDWRFSWYTATIPTIGLDFVNIHSEKYSVQQLPDSQSEAGGIYSLGSVSENHTGVYICRAERDGPDTQTLHSYPQLLWVADRSPPASLSISPNRCQHFVDEPILLSCEVQGNSSEWRLMTLRNKGTLLTCNPSGQSTCSIPNLKTTEAGVYWCESGTREYSNPINITVSVGTTVLKSPIMPLAEGDSLTLRCLVKAGLDVGTEVKFFKDGSLIKTEAKSVLTIQHIAKSDEGMYTCKVPSQSESPASWVAVRSSSSGPRPKGLHVGEIVVLGVAALTFVVTISGMVTMFFFKNSNGQNIVSVPAADRKANMPVATETSASSEPLYSVVKKGRSTVESDDVIYTTVVIKEGGSGTSNRREDP